MAYQSNRKLITRIGSWSFVGLLLIIIVIVPLYLSTQGAKTTVTNYLNRHFQSKTMTFKINHIYQFYPFKIDIAFINFHESNRPWLSAHHIQGLISCNKLLPKPFFLGSINIEKIDFIGLPHEPDNQSHTDHQQSAKDTVKEIQDQIAGIKLPCPLSLFITCPAITLPTTISHSLRQPLSSQFYFSSNAGNDLNAHLIVHGHNIQSAVQAIGKFNNFKITAAAYVPTLTLNNNVVNELALSFQAGELPYYPYVTTRLICQHNDYPAYLQFKGATSQSLKSITGHLKFYGFDTVVGAAGKYNYINGNTNSAINFYSADLTSVAQLFTLSLGGKCRGSAHIYKKADVINLTIKSEISKFKGFYMSVDKLFIDTHLNTLLQQPTGSLNVKASHLQYDNIQCDVIDIISNLKHGQGPCTIIVKGQPLNGHIDGQLNLQPDQQCLSLNQLAMDYDGYKLKLLKPVILEHQQNFIKLNSASFDLMNMPLTLAGTIKDDQIDSNVVGQLNLKFIERAFLTNGDRLKGIVNLNMAAQGPLKAPQLTGTININQGYYENFQFGVLLKNITLMTQFKNNSLLIKRGSAQDVDKGLLNLTGQYLIAEKKLNINLSLNNFYIAKSDALTLFTPHSTIKAAGALNHLKITGNIDIDRSFFNIAYTLGNDVPTLNIIDPRHPMPVTTEDNNSSSLNNTDLDIGIALKSPLRVFGKGLDSLWIGDIKISQHLDDPKLKGQLQLKRGQLAFLGQKLKLSKGTILFDGIEKNMPYIDIEATLNRSDLTAMINVLGRADHLQFNLSSSPSMEQDEILAYILFGKEPGHLSPLQAIQLGRALLALQRGDKSDNFIDVISQNLGLNALFSSDHEDEDDTGLSSSKKLMDRINISFDQGIGAEDTKAIIQLQLSKRFILETSISPGPSGESVSLNYKKVY